MTSPPPPPFGTGSPQFPYDRATLKAQRRAAAQQARLQQQQMRLQARAARRGSLVGPVLLLVLGVVLLVVETGRWQWGSAVLWLAHWWPLILILAGVVLLAEYGLDRAFPTTLNGFPVRRTLGGGTAFLLVLITLLGIGSSLAERSSDWARLNISKNLDLGDVSHWPQFFGSRSEYTETLEAPLLSGGTLTIQNGRGNISIVGSSQDGHIHVTARQHVYAWHTEDMDARRRQEMPHFTGDSHHQILTIKAQDADDADLTLEVPHDSLLSIDSEHGDVSVEELHGALDLTAQSGSIKLTGLKGPVRLNTADDSAEIDAHSLDGGLTLQGRTGDVNLSDITGPLSLQGDFFGTTHLEHVRGTVHFKSSFTDFSCNGLPGDLNIEGRSDLDAREVQGPLNLVTTNRNLTLDAVRGAAHISDRNGSVHLGLASPLQPVEVSNQNGSVELSVPPGSHFALQSSTHNGDIHNGFGLQVAKVGETSQLNATVGGGGPLLHVQTSEGDIDLQRTGKDEQAADWDDDTSARITPKPAHTAKPHSSAHATSSTDLP